MLQNTKRRFVGPFAVLIAVSALVLGGCASTLPVAEFEDLPSAEQLYSDGMGELESERDDFNFFLPRDYTASIEVFQDVIDNYPYSDQATLAELAIGDAYFAQKSYDEAISYYSDFIDLHPGHDQVPYAMFQTGLSFYKRSKEPGRDQTATQDGITHFDRLLRRFPHSEYSMKAEENVRELRGRLAEHTLQVGDYYFGTDEYASAAERYRGLLNEYPGLGFDAEALYKLGVCYTRMNRGDEAQQIFQVILENYEGSEVAEAAADLVPAAQ
ncbi:MAG: outer membrane protein assembly factor BamD [Myxococcota bacterium]|nr:outer membrane protein assembly factor BamD [Myxococcota bacterium]